MLKRSRRDRGRRQLVLHMGSGKTGTSSLQFLLGENRERLAAAGWLYPRTPADRRHRHARLGLFVQPDDRLTEEPRWRREEHRTPAEFREAFHRDLTAEISGSGLSRVLLSDEALYGSVDAALLRLRELTDALADRLRIVVYLRRQDDHLISRYQQVVKVGETRRLAERARSLDFSGTYDYHARLSNWCRLLEPAALVVRRFERPAFVEGSLYQDFLAAVGVDLRAGDLREVERQNESLDAEAVELLRLLNIVRVEQAGGRPRHINNRKHVIRLAAAADGPVLTLPEATLDAFMARWDQSNVAVARDFLGESHGELFTTARRTRNTTTEQLLDPGRLGHYIELLELPQRLHAPLRRVAESEARTSS